MLQVSPLGRVRTFTLYADPLATGVLNTNLTFPVNFSSSPDLSSRVTESPVFNPATAPPMVYPQVTSTVATLDEPTVPEGFWTMQVWPFGCVLIVTSYLSPTSTAVVKVNLTVVEAYLPGAATVSRFPPLSSRTTESPPFSPVAVPPMVWPQVTSTFLILDAATLPDALATVQVSPLGCLLIVMSYFVPEGKAAANVNTPFAVTFTEAFPSSRVTEPPVFRPVTDPPMVNDAPNALHVAAARMKRKTQAEWIAVERSVRMMNLQVARWPHHGEDCECRPIPKKCVDCETRFIFRLARGWLCREKLPRPYKEAQNARESSHRKENKFTDGTPWTGFRPWSGGVAAVDKAQANTAFQKNTAGGLVSVEGSLVSPVERPWATGGNASICPGTTPVCQSPFRLDPYIRARHG